MEMKNILTHFYTHLTGLFLPKKKKCHSHENKKNQYMLYVNWPFR